VVLVSLATSLRLNTESITSELGPLLSKNAEIILQSDSEFTEASKRWQCWAAPDVNMVVEVQTEEDVQQTVRTLCAVFAFNSTSPS
jgi:hypothetical protein